MPLNNGLGLITTDLGSSQDWAREIIVQTDGKIIVVGSSNSHFAIVRYMSNGTLDSNFGTFGKVILPVDLGYGAYSVVQQNDGKILVSGSKYAGNRYDFELIRLNSDGKLDSSFNGGGKVITTLNGSGSNVVTAVQENGGIIVAGTLAVSATETNFVLIRYLENGAIDSSFGTGGIASTNIGIFDDLYGISVQSDNKIVAIGNSSNGSGNDFTLVRYNLNGTLDTSFSSDGILLTDFGGDDFARDVSIQEDGKIVVVGNSDGNFAVARYLPNGFLDTSFHATGKVTTKISNHNFAKSVAIQPDGKIIVGGDAWTWGSFALVRYNSNGSLDKSFDGDGVVTTKFTDYRDEGSSVAIQTDGKILFAGTAWGFDFALARYNTDGSLDNFGPDSSSPSINVISPAANASEVPIGSNIVITYNENIQRGTGHIYIKTLGGMTVGTYDVSTSINLLILGNNLTINPTVDLAYSTGYTVEFAAGSIKDLAGNAYAGTTSYNFTTVADTTNQTFTGTAAAESFTSRPGNDTIDGGPGIDTAIFNGNLANYTLTKSGSTYTVRTNTGADGTDTLTNVESLKFADVTVNLQVQGIAAAAPLTDVQRISELYVAFFNRTPDADGLAYWIGQKMAGQSINQISESFYNVGASSTFSGLTGFSTSMSNADFLNVFYKNVLGRPEGADAGGLAYWNGKLAGGSSTRSSLANDILDSAHSFKGNPTWGWVADLLDNKIAVANTIAVDWGLTYNTDAYTRGVTIAAAITPTDTSEALKLVGVSAADLNIG